MNRSQSVKYSHAQGTG